MRLLGDLRCPIPAALAAPDFEAALQALLAQRAGRMFWLDTIFGIDPRHAHDVLAAEIHRRVPAPALRVGFIKRERTAGACRACARCRSTTCAAGNATCSSRR